MNPQNNLQQEESPRYRVQRAVSFRHRSQLFRLRYEVFHREARNAPIPWGIDHDRFDLVAEHLIVVDTLSNRVVGTYRMISGKRAKRFYSETEFDLSNLAQDRSQILELGRACIAKEFRNGVVLAMLWKGVLAHAKEIGAKYLLGCSSIFTDSTDGVLLLMEELDKKGKVDLSSGANPTLNTYPARDGSGEIAELPPLLRAYLSANAKIVSQPAWDPFFKCFDVLTYLNLEELPRRFLR